MGLLGRVEGLCKLGVVLAASHRLPSLQRLMPEDTWLSPSVPGEGGMCPGSPGPALPIRQ